MCIALFTPRYRKFNYGNSCSLRCRKLFCASAPRTFIRLTVSVWNDLSDLLFDGVELAGFKSRVWNWRVSTPFLSALLFPLSSFCLSVVIVRQGSLVWYGVNHSLPNNNNNNYQCSFSYRIIGVGRPKRCQSFEMVYIIFIADGCNIVSKNFRRN